MSFYFDVESYMLGFEYELDELTEADFEMEEDEQAEFAAKQYEKLYCNEDLDGLYE